MNYRKTIAIAALTILSTGCTTTKGEWGKWRNNKTDIKYDVSQIKLEKPLELDYNSPPKSFHDASYSLRPQLSIEPKIQADKTTTQYYYRTKKDVRKIFNPFEYTKLVAEMPIIIFMIPIPLAMDAVTLPFRLLGNRSWKEDYTWHEETKSSAQTESVWLAPSELPYNLQRDLEVNIPQLSLEQSLRNKTVHLSNYTSRLMSNDDLKVSVELDGVELNTKVSTAAFKEAELKRQKMNKQRLAYKQKQQELKLAAEQRERDRIEEARLAKIADFKKKLNHVKSLEASGDIEQALSEQMKLIDIVRAGDSSYGVSRRVLIDKATELASAAGDIDAITKLMDM